MSVSFNATAEQSYDLDAINKFLDGGSRYSIPHASYVLSARNGSSFYTFDGNAIVTVERSLNFTDKDILLDKAAPNPRPVTFEIRRYVPSEKAVRISGGLAHLQRLYLYEIYFCDKNDNEIAWCSYSGSIPATRETLKKYECIKMLGNKTLDLSGIVEDQTFLWANPATWFKRFKIHA